MKLNIIYWSGTGNTEKMAELIKEGAESVGSSVTMKAVDSANSGDASDCDVLVLGCPAMGSEVLEEMEFEPYMESIENNISGKKVALFGSYDWGDGQWMRDWEDRVKSKGVTLIQEGLIVNNTPEDDDIEKCKNFGISIAK